MKMPDTEIGGFLVPSEFTEKVKQQARNAYDTMMRRMPGIESDPLYQAMKDVYDWSCVEGIEMDWHLCAEVAKRLMKKNSKRT